MPPVVYENRVRYAEADPQEIVFYGNYVTFQDESLMAFLREIGYGHSDDWGWDLHVVHMEMDYRAPARVGDVLENEFRITGIGEASIDSEYRARRKADGTVIAEGSLTHVAVDEPQGESIRVPDAFRDAVVAYQDEPPDPV